MSKLIFCNNNFYRNPELFSIYIILNCKCYADRTKLFNDYIKVDSLPDTWETSMSFEDCMLSAAEELWKQHDDLVLMWSGGIDSTAILIALKETQPKNTNLRLFYTQESIDHFPRMYEKWVKHMPRVRILTKNDKIIHGTLGDQLYSGFYRAVQKTMDCLEMPWTNFIFHERFRACAYETHLNTSVEDPFLNWNKQKGNFLKTIESLNQSAPCEIKSLLDMYWWIGITQSWMYAKLWMQYFYRVFPPSDHNNHIAFYDTLDFQRWSFCNRDRFMHNRKDWRTYKQESKNFIHRYFHDEDYRVNFIKIQSHGQFTITKYMQIESPPITEHSNWQQHLRQESGRNNPVIMAFDDNVVITLKKPIPDVNSYTIHEDAAKTRIKEVLSNTQMLELEKIKFF